MAYQKLSKVEKNRRHKEAEKNRLNFIIEYQKEKYKFVNVQFRFDNETDVKILQWLDSKEESRATIIKQALLEQIKKEGEN